MRPAGAAAKWALRAMVCRKFAILQSRWDEPSSSLALF